MYTTKPNPIRVLTTNTPIRDSPNLSNPSIYSISKISRKKKG